MFPVVAAAIWFGVMNVSRVGGGDGWYHNHHKVFGLILRSWVCDKIVIDTLVKYGNR